MINVQLLPFANAKKIGESLTKLGFNVAVEDVSVEKDILIFRKGKGKALGLKRRDAWCVLMGVPPEEYFKYHNPSSEVPSVKKLIRLTAKKELPSLAEMPVEIVSLHTEVYALVRVLKILLERKRKC